jgi:hypothetical protein
MFESSKEHKEIVIAATDKTRPAFDSIMRSYRDVEKAHESFAASLAKIPSLQSTIVSAMSSVGALSLVNFIRSSIDAADSINDLSQKIGVSVKDLAVWKLAAEQNGTSLETIASATKKLSTYMGEHGDRLRAVGVTAKDTNGVLIQLSDIFANMPDGMEKSRLSLEVFGRAGLDMIPLMNQGSKGLAEVADKTRVYAERLSVLAPQADRFNDQMSELKVNLEAAWIKGMSPHMQGLIDFAKSMSDASASTDGMRKSLEELAKVTQSGPLSIFNAGAVGIDIWQKAEKYFKPRSIGWTGPKDAAGLPDTYSYIGGAQLPGNNSAAEKEALRKSRILAPAKAEKSDLQKFLDKKQQSEIDDYYRFSSEEEMRSAIFKNADLSRRDEESVQRLAQKYKDIADPLQKYRVQLGEINSLRERGLLTADQAIAAEFSVDEAMQRQFDTMNNITDAVEKQNDIGRELGMTFSSAFEDAIIGGKKFDEVLQSIAVDIQRIMIRKTITEPLAQGMTDMLKGFDLGSLFMNADGGVYDSPSLSQYSGGVYDSPQYFKFAKGAGMFAEAGPEAIMPLRRDSAGMLGVSAVGAGTTVNVYNQAPGVQATARESRDNNGRAIIDVVVEAVEGRLVDSMARNGRFGQALQSVYSMNRNVM